MGQQGEASGSLAISAARDGAAAEDNPAGTVGLLFALVGASLLGLTLLVGWKVLESRAQALEDQRRHGHHLAAILVQEAFHLTAVDGLALRQAAALRSWKPDEAAGALHDLASRSGILGEIGLTDADGRVVASGVLGGAGVASLAGDPLVLGQRDDPECDLLYGPMATGKRVAFAGTLCLRDGTGRFVGVAYALSRADFMARLAGHMDVGPKGGFGLLFRDGRPALGEPSGRGLADLGLDGGVLAGMASQGHANGADDPSYRVLEGQDGRRLGLTVLPVPDSPVLAWVAMDTDHGLGRWRSDTATMLLVVLVLFAVASSLAWALRRRLVQEAASAARVRANEAWLERVLDSAGEGIYGTDTKGRTVFVNQAAAQLTGWRAADLMGRNIHDLIHHTRADGMPAEWVECPTRRALAEGVAIRASGEFFWRKDGSSFPVEVVAAPILVDGLAIGAVTLFQDITQRERQRRELELSNAHLRQFAYVASHDLQEPLRLMTSYAQLLEHRYAHQLDREAGDYLGFIVKGAKRASSLIKDLLVFARLGSDAPMGPVDMGRVMDLVRLNLRREIDEAEAELDARPLPRLLGTEVQLVTLMQNLVGNAIKYRDPARPLKVIVDAVRQDGMWLFSVADNGIGIDAEYWERIFAIFQRLHTQDRYSGTGIGLAICLRVVERHGGRIWVESTPGKGSTFFFTLPAGEV